MALSSNLSISTLTHMYRAGTTTPEQVIHHIYDQIEAQPLHPVWIAIVPRALALDRAREVQTRHPGALYGIPFAVKDNIDVAGLTTTAGCPAFGYMPEASATVVQRLLDAGAMVIGKTNLDQFATGLVGTRSPFGACSSVFNEKYISGGSSAGSAVAVARGLVSFALGTDTAGSGRVPAAFNNLVGLKPTRGLLSAHGVVPACRSLDCVSIFTLDAADAAQVFVAARGYDAQDPYSRTMPVTAAPVPAILRCGVPKPSQLQFFGDRNAARTYHDTVADLERAGATLVEVDLDPFLAAAELLYAGPYVAERYAAVGRFVEEHGDAVDPTVGAIIRKAAHYTAAEAFAAQYKLQSLKQQTSPVWEKIDVLVLPTAPTTYAIDEVQRDPIRLNANLGYYTNFVNLLDLSAMAIPAGFRPDGLPFGVTAIAPAFSEHLLLPFASHLQRLRVTFAGAQVANLDTLPAYQPQQGSQGWIKVAVVGAHLSGQPLNSQLTERGARLVRTAHTAPDYKLYALSGTLPPKPGLVRTPGTNGPGIEVEVWLMPVREFGSFVALIPPPLGIGTCELSDGEFVKSFVCESYATVGAVDITAYGGWRKYLGAPSG